MRPGETCQVCGQPPSEELLRYRKGAEEVRHGSLLQCDICERCACSSCLQVYDIYSGYDFLCRDCVKSFPPSP